MVAKKGISACQLQRELGMKSYKSAWRMLRLIREVMGKEEYKNTFEAIVEVDETCVGGKPRKENLHNERETSEKFNKRGRGSSSKTPVIGVKERSSGRVHCVVATANANGQKLTGKQLLKVLNDACKEGTSVMTDQYSGYNVIDAGRIENTNYLSIGGIVPVQFRFFRFLFTFASVHQLLAQYAVHGQSLRRRRHAGKADGGPSPPPGRNGPSGQSRHLCRRVAGCIGEDERFRPDPGFRRPRRTGFLPRRGTLRSGARVGQDRD